MSKRLAVLGLALTAAVVAAPTAAHAEPTCPPGWTGVYVTVPGTGIRRLVACLPPAP